MFDMTSFIGMTRKEKYENLLLMLKGILEPGEEEITKLSNAAALINALSEDISWCGFYLLRDKELILGPFQGLPACTKIPLGKGVCGTSAEKREIIIVEDVKNFPGHIACDSASRSEIVLPIIKDGRLIGVLDIDSTTVDRFTEEDRFYLKEAVDILAETL